MGDRVEIFGIGVDVVDAGEAVARALDMALAGRASYVVTPNVEIVMAARSDEELRRSLNGADLAVGDGIGLVWASRILGKPLPARVSGIDLMTDLLREASKHGLRVFLLGSTQEVVTAAAERMRSVLGAEVVGFHHGFFLLWRSRRSSTRYFFPNHISYSWDGKPQTGTVDGRERQSDRKGWRRSRRQLLLISGAKRTYRRSCASWVWNGCTD